MSSFAFNNNVLIVPITTDVVVARNTTDTLTNKTISGGASGNAITTNQLYTGGTPVTISGASAINQTLLTTSTTAASYGQIYSALYFGNGADADPNIGSGVTVTIVRDMYYANLTIALNGVLNTGGFRVFVRDTTTCNGNINNNGRNAAGSTAGAATTNGSIGRGVAGGNGSAVGAGTAGGNVTANTQMGGNGGAGGSGNSGANAGGAAGASTSPPATSGGLQIWNSLSNSLRGRDIAAIVLNGGCGGGGGGDAIGGGAGNGGGGGGGAGVVILATNVLLGSGSITANGGNGANATAADPANAAGGGAGGGGGAIVIAYNLSTFAGATTCAGGAGGASGGPGGVAGGSGVAGNVYTNPR